MTYSSPPLLARPGQDCVLAINPGKHDRVWTYWVRRRYSSGRKTSFIHVSQIEHLMPTEQHRYSRDQTTKLLKNWLGDVWHDPAWDNLYIDKNGSSIKLSTSNHSRTTRSYVRHSHSVPRVDVMNLGLVAGAESVAVFTTMFAGEEVSARVMPFDDQADLLAKELRAIQILAAQRTKYPLLPKILAYAYDGSADNVVGFIFKLQLNEPRVEDLQACNNALTDLHSFGILHGNLKGNVAMSPDGPIFLDFTSAEFRDDRNISPQEWKELSDAEHGRLNALEIFRKPLDAASTTIDPLNSEPASMVVFKSQQEQSSASDISSIPNMSTIIPTMSPPHWRRACTNR